MKFCACFPPDFSTEEIGGRGRDADRSAGEAAHPQPSRASQEIHVRRRISGAVEAGRRVRRGGRVACSTETRMPPHSGLPINSLLESHGSCAWATGITTLSALNYRRSSWQPSRLLSGYVPSLPRFLPALEKIAAQLKIGVGTVLRAAKDRTAIRRVLMSKLEVVFRLGLAHRL